MKSVNKVILVGNLAADPEIRYTGTGTAVAHFRIATNESWSGKDGNKEERTEWHRVVAWGKLGEICGEYLSKGRQVFIEGKLRTNAWETKEGEKRYSTEIHATDVVFLGGKGSDAGTGQGRPKGDFDGAPAHFEEPQGGGASAGHSSPAPSNAGADEDIPF
jgi:single-strand DNA-binding protein